jgi:hypothetical protein
MSIQAIVLDCLLKTCPIIPFIFSPGLDMKKVMLPEQEVRGPHLYFIKHGITNKRLAIVV